VCVGVCVYVCVREYRCVSESVLDVRELALCGCVCVCEREGDSVLF